MKKYSIFFLSIGLVFSSHADPELDARFAMRQVVLSVVNPNDKLVYADSVEAALAEEIKNDSRFDWAADAFLYARQNLRAVPTIPLGTPGRENLGPFVPLLQQMSGFGADSAVLVEVQRGGDTYRIMMTLVTIPAIDKIQTVVQEVEASQTVESFQNAARAAWGMLVSSIPFDGTVLTREGYRVVIDRGGRGLKVGMRLPVYTLEPSSQSLSLDETGLIELKRVERKISFGEVVVERRPREVMAGNKLRIGAVPIPDLRKKVDALPSVATELPTPDGRSIASVPGQEQTIRASLSETPTGRRFGGLDVNAMGTFLSWSRTAASGGRRSDSAFFPGANARGEIWIYPNTFLDLGFAYGTTVFPAAADGTIPALGAKMMQMRLQGGYRFAIKQIPSAPSLTVRLGYGRDQFTTDDTLQPLAPSSITYSGILATASFDLPLGRSWSTGLEFDTMLFASGTEGSLTSANQVSSASFWNVSLGLQYHWFENLSAVLRGTFQSASSDYTGTGDRPTPLASASQDGQSVGLGLKYYF